MDIEPDMFGYVPRPRHASFVTHRSYFALLPPPGVAQEIEDMAKRWARPYGVRRVTLADRLHVSLNRLPDGELAEPYPIDDAIEVGAAIRRSSFELSFDILETWGGKTEGRGGRPRPIVLRCSTPPRAATALYQDLWQAMRRYGLPLGPRQFNPHMTLWYQSNTITPLRLSQPIRFRAERFWLVHSINGARRLEDLASWQLKF